MLNLLHLWIGLSRSSIVDDNKKRPNCLRTLGLWLLILFGEGRLMSRCRIRVRAGLPFLILGVFAVGALGPISMDIAAAQSRGGTYGGHANGAAPQPWLANDEREAGRLLAEAREHLAQGKALEGRRRLEVLVARYPDTAAADEARRELGRVYTREQPGPKVLPGRVAPSLALSPADPRLDSGGAVRQPVNPDAPMSAARVPGSDMNQLPNSLRATRAIQQEFRLSIGDRVFFGEASAELGSRARAVLAAQAQWLGRFPGVPILVEGHADEVGSNDYNRELGLKRAHAVRMRLIEEGIEPGRVTAMTYGRAQPVANCAAADCAAHNRRVVTVLAGSPSEAMSPSSAPGQQGARDMRARTGN